MKLTHRIEKQICIIAFVGNLTTDAVEEFKSFLTPFVEDEQLLGIVINCRYAVTIDSTGIGVIVSTFKQLQRRQAKLSVCALSDHYTRLFRASQLDKILNLHPLESEGMESILQSFPTRASNDSQTEEADTKISISADLEKALNTIINTGAQRAATSLSELLMQEVELITNQVQIMSRGETRQFMSQLPHEGYIVVVQNLIGEFEAQGVLSFPLMQGRNLIHTLFDLPPTEESEFGFNEMEAITEVGNVLVNALGSSVGDHTEMLMDYQVARLIIAEQLIPLDQKTLYPTIYCGATTHFQATEIDVDGYISLVITKPSLEKIETQFKTG